LAGSEKCASCHKEVADGFAGSPHAKADPPRGGVSCEDCHGAGSAHAEAGDPAKISNPGKLSSSARNHLCTQCHAQEAGPFTHEHPVVKIESCLACHAPHASQNAHMLTVSDVNTLCQQCHSLAASAASSDRPAHNPAAQLTPCTNCHVQVHGSNVSNVFFK
jgi:predicted CXXCH cytochrome family protein